MRVLILGGTGLTGPHVVRRLHGLGHHVTVFHRGEHEVELPSGVRHVHGDFTNLPPELLDPDPDVAIHMWAMTQRDAESFLERFSAATNRVVVISSGDVYRAYGRLRRQEAGPPDPVPLGEDAPLRESRYPYRDAASSPDHWMAHYDKILVEQTIARQADLPWTILRFPAVLGPNEYRRFRQWLQPMLRGDSELRIQDDWADWRWTHGFAEDVAQAVVLAATHPAATGHIYNVGESETPSMLERLTEFARLAGWHGCIRKVPGWDRPEADRTPYDFGHHLVYDTSRIRIELGYAEVVPREESLMRMLDMERES